MGVFNFIETIFFVSLGITFVLILLLVYHFKQRISAIEQKADTMLEIINNVVKEIYTLKNAQQMTNRFFTTMPMDNNSFQVPPAVLQVPVSFTPMQKINVSDNEDGSSDSEDDVGDSDDDLCDSDNDNDVGDNDIDDSDNEDDTGDSGNENESATSSVEPLTYEALPPLEEDVVKVINVSLDIPMDSTDLTDANESTSANELAEAINEEDPIEDLNPAPIHVEKIDSDEPENLDEVIGEQKESSKEVYRKMTLQSLKALVITKGLCSDPSKMKKQELLKLLESVDE